MARPRKVSSKDILAAAYEVIIEYGPVGLTFDRLGERVGLVPGALVRRFANKRQLLAEIDGYALERSNAALQEVMERHDSPIEAIIAGLTTEMSFASTIKKFINAQSFLLIDLEDKDLYANYHVSFHQRQQKIAELLKSAQDRGEISAELDVGEFAALLQAIQQGSGHVWAMTQKEPIEQLIERSVRLVLKPYSINQSKDDIKSHKEIS